MKDHNLSTSKLVRHC